MSEPRPEQWSLACVLLTLMLMLTKVCVFVCVSFKIAVTDCRAELTVGKGKLIVVVKSGGFSVCVCVNDVQKNESAS